MKYFLAFLAMVVASVILGIVRELAQPSCKRSRPDYWHGFAVGTINILIWNAITEQST